MYTFEHDHLLQADALSVEDIDCILSLAKIYANYNRHKTQCAETLAGKTLINAFFENSTRTFTSFDLAGKRLGANTINMAVETSSIRKGETLIDTAETLNAMLPHILVIRHGDSGAVKLLSRKVNCSVINAGDGEHEHPTQALLDALTIKMCMGKFSGLTLAICGDILHSRVARSNIHILKKLGVNVRVVAPRSLIPEGIETLGAEVFEDMKEGIKGCDIIMVLRLQLERMQGAFVPNEREYNRFFGLTPEKLAMAKKGAFVMHPGPINRGVEIDSTVADDLCVTVIRQQVELGVAVRMACLDLLAHKRPSICL